jgi:hypothetical protein
LRLPVISTLRAVTFNNRENRHCSARQVIVIRAERITGVGPSAATRAGAQVIDLSNATVLTGSDRYASPGSERRDFAENSQQYRELIALKNTQRDPDGASPRLPI